MVVLVLDEQIANPKLVEALAERGIAASTVGDFGLTGRPDPDVVKRVQGRLSRQAWVLVTMDLTITQDHPGFRWDDYALAWIRPRQNLRGIAVEQEKANIVQRHAHAICQQQPGDHHTYTTTQRFKSPPSLTSLLQRPS